MEVCSHEVTNLDRAIPRLVIIRQFNAHNERAGPGGDQCFFISVRTETFRWGVLRISDFKKILGNFENKSKKNKNVDYDEKIKIAKNSNTAVRSC